MPETPSLSLEDLQQRFAAHGQAHVFAYWDRLDAKQQEQLLGQTARIAPQLDELMAAIASPEAGPAAAVELVPASAIALPEHGGDAQANETARRRGVELLAEGRVGVFVVAGGQGTRLGFSGPKGAYPVGPVTDRCLFEIQAQKIRGLRRRTGCRVPWYVMTSLATDAPTRALFESSDYFGLPAEDVFLFAQEMVPAFDFEGRLLLETPDRIFESPNGHGGSLTALASSGALDDMERRGIDTIFYYQVDNPLVRIGDPVYLGHHDLAGAQMSCKVIRKTDPMEKVGIVARMGGDLGVVEYTELDDEQRYARDADGQLTYWAGNCAIHLFEVSFVRDLARRAAEVLPYHLSAKKIPTVDALGRPIATEQPNGHKLERFVFDALPVADRVCIVEADTQREFAPIKNADGSDSPETSRRALMTLYREWLSAADLEPPPEHHRVEIDHSIIDSLEDAEHCGFRSLEDAGDAIRTAPGTSS